MADKLGDMLVSRGYVTAQQLDEALKSQVIFGGRLGTNLIELGHIDEETLSQALSEKFGVPAVDPEKIMSLSPEVAELLPLEIIQRYKVVPLELDKKRLMVAMSDPSDLAALDEISFRTGYIIKPLVIPEVRLVAALEKYYGIKREFRYINVTRKGRNNKAPLAGTVAAAWKGQEDMVDFSELPAEMMDAEPLEEVDEAPPAPPEPVQAVSAPTPSPVQSQVLRPQEPPVASPAPATPSPRSQPPQPQASPVQPTPQPAPAPPASPAPAAPPPQTPPAAVQQQQVQPESYTMESLSLDLADAADRDEIASCLVAYLGQEYERAVFFLLRGQKAQGWKGVVRGKPVPRLESADFPLAAGSVLTIVSEGKSFYLGPIPPGEANKPMLEVMGGDARRPACLVPLMMMGKVVAVLFVDGGRKKMNDALPDLQRLVSKASMAFEILILRNKILNM